MKEKCLLYVNTGSGGINKRQLETKIIKKLQAKYDIDLLEFGDGVYYDLAKKCQGYDALAFCGGDGTLNYVINQTKNTDIDLYYLAGGTLNEAAKSLKRYRRIWEKHNYVNKDLPLAVDICKFNDRLFTYVAATGSFTPIGYMPKKSRFRLIKYFGYLINAFKQLKVHAINAEITTEKQKFVDCYTLIMAVKSKRVFGFYFNKQYTHNSGKAHLLLLKSPQNNFWGKIKLICMCARVFVFGIRKTIDSENIKFVEFERLNIMTDKPLVYCMDGERFEAQNISNITVQQQSLKINIL